MAERVEKAEVGKTKVIITLKNDKTFSYEVTGWATQYAKKRWFSQTIIYADVKIQKSYALVVQELRSDLYGSLLRIVDDFVEKSQISTVKTETLEYWVDVELVNYRSLL